MNRFSRLNGRASRGIFSAWLMFAGLSLFALTTHADSNFLMDPMPHKPDAPGFKLPDIKGEVRDFSEFAGKHVLVNFWTTTCLPCVREMAALHHQRELLQSEGLEIVAIHAGPDKDGGIAEFLETNPVTFPILIDSDLEMGDWGIPALPTTYMVDPDGKLLYRAVGDRNWAAPVMTDFLQSVLDRYEAADET